MSNPELKRLLKYNPGLEGMDDDIHKSRYRTELELKKIAKRHPGPNYELACRYIDRLHMANRSLGRISSYAAGVAKILDICGATVAEWSREDVERIHKSIACSRYSNSVKKDTLTCLKRLYHFAVHGDIPNKAAGGQYDPMVAWITPGAFNERHQKIQPMDLLTEEEVLALVRAVKDTGRHVRRNVALIFMMLEGAYRPGEILSIRVGGVELYDGFAKVITTGKTGPKSLTLVSSFGPLREWLSEHPRVDDPEAFLMFHNNAAGVMGYSSLAYTISSAQRRAGIKKRIWPYLFRHTALTEYSKLMGNVAKIYGNWTASSNMISVYEHLASSDQEDAVLRLHGMRNERRRSAVLLARQCPSCGVVSSADREACPGCGGGMEGAGHPMEGPAVQGQDGWPAGHPAGYPAGGAYPAPPAGTGAGAGLAGAGAVGSAGGAAVPAERPGEGRAWTSGPAAAGAGRARMQEYVGYGTGRGEDGQRVDPGMPARTATRTAARGSSQPDDADAKIKRLEEANARLQGMVGDLLARLSQ